MKLKILSETILNSIKQYRFRSIFIKNFIIYITSITLPIILLNIFAFNLFTNQLNIENDKASTVSLVRLSETVVSSFDESLDIAYILNANPYIQTFLDQEKLSANELTKQTQNISNLFSAFINSNEYIDSIMLFSEKQNFIYGSRSSGTLKDYYDTSWYEDYKNNKNNTPVWRVYRKIKRVDIGRSPEISVITQFFIIQTDSSNYGLIAINLNLEAFVENEKIKADKIYILNNEEIIYPRVSENITAEYKKELLEKVKIHSYSGKINKFDFSDSDFYVHRDSIHDLYFVLSPIKDIATKTRMIIISFLTVTVSLLVVIILSATVEKKSMQPIEKIISFIKEQTPNQHMQVSISASEIDFIIDTMTKSFNLNQDLKSELSTNLFTLQQYQVMALQNQINPHFLYNTLNTINLSAMEMTGGENETSTMIEDLSQLFRLAFSSGNYLITLEDEIEYLKKYINLQKKRWPNMFDVEFDISDEIMNLNVFKFSIQPIVENSINHGIKPLSQKGIISISAKKHNDSLLIVIKDNGVGINKAKLKEIKSLLSKPYLEPLNSHIGLSNVNNRIKLMFGNKYGIKIESEEMQHTTVIYTLPIIDNDHKGRESIE